MERILLDVVFSPTNVESHLEAVDSKMEGLMGTWRNLNAGTKQAQLLGGLLRVLLF